jgi:hypothetical protein
MTSRLIKRYAMLDAGRIAALARRMGMGAGVGATSVGAGLLSLGLAAGVMTPLAGLLAPTEAVAQERDADYSQFYDQLEQYGRWKEHPEYGYVWLPDADDGTWRPYTKGHWVNTEEHGWYWNSEEPWGWATYHYGRWIRDEEDGWIWIPGREWAPAWVAWREGDDYVGWAPLPPEASWEPGRGEMRFASSYYESPRFEPFWIFCRPMHMVEPGMHRYIVPRSRSPFVLRNTVYVSNSYSFRDQRVYNSGIRVNLVERSLNRSLPPVRIVATDSHHDHGLRHEGGRRGPTAGQVAAGVAVGVVTLGVLNVFRPKLAPRVAGGPSPAPRNFVPQTGGGGRGFEGRPVRPTGGVGLPPRTTEGQRQPLPPVVQPPQLPSVFRGGPAPQPPVQPPVQPPSQPQVQRPPSGGGGGFLSGNPAPQPPAQPPSQPQVQRPPAGGGGGFLGNGGSRAPQQPVAAPPVVQRPAPLPAPPVQQRAPQAQPPQPRQQPVAQPQPQRPQQQPQAQPQGPRPGQGQGQPGQKRNPNDPNQPPR